MSTVSFGGLASGLDTEAIINALMSTARRPITLAQDKKATLNSKLSAYNSLSSGLSQIRTAARDLDSVRDFRALAATSSDETALRATASSTANPGTYQMTVNSLAQPERTYSDPFATQDTAGAAGTGTLTITVGAGTPVDVTIDATDTLETIAGKINDADVEVSASIVFDGTNYRLLVMGENSGAANSVTFAESGTLILDLDDVANEAQAAVDANVTMDGITFTDESNQMTQMIPGVTLDLLDTTTGPVTVKVDMDLDAMAAKVQSFITAYNSTAKFLTDQFAYKGEARNGTLVGDVAARSVKARMQDILSDVIPGLSGTYTQLSQLGVSSENDGTLKFDTAEFKTAMGTDANAVIDVFAHDDGDDNLDEDGVAVRFVNAVDQLLQAPDGLIPVRQDGLNDSIKAQDARIEKLEYQLESYEETLRRQFAAMEEAMAGYNSTSEFLTRQQF